MLYFRSSPYENPNYFGIAHEIVAEAVATYKPELYGWKYAPSLLRKSHITLKTKQE